MGIWYITYCIDFRNDFYRWMRSMNSSHSRLTHSAMDSVYNNWIFLMNEKREERHEEKGNRNTSQTKYNRERWFWVRISFFSFFSFYFYFRVDFMPLTIHLQTYALYDTQAEVKLQKYSRKNAITIKTIVFYFLSNPKIYGDVVKRADNFANLSYRTLLFVISIQFQ